MRLLCCTALVASKETSEEITLRGARGAGAVGLGGILLDTAGDDLGTRSDPLTSSSDDGSLALDEGGACVIAGADRVLVSTICEATGASSVMFVARRKTAAELTQIWKSSVPEIPTPLS